MTRLIAASAFALTLTGAVDAQDELVGTWEQDLGVEEGLEGSVRLTLDEDHTFEIVLQAEFAPEFLEVVAGAFGEDEGEHSDPEIPSGGEETPTDEEPTKESPVNDEPRDEDGDSPFGFDGEELFDLALLSDGFELEIVVRGSWETENELLTLQFEEIEIGIDGGTVDEFFEASARDLAALLAEEQGVADDEYEEFEEAVVTLFMLQVDTEDFERAFGEAFTRDDVTEFSVDGDSLLLLENGDINAEFTRVTPSVISESSWGQGEEFGFTSGSSLIYVESAQTQNDPDDQSGRGISLPRRIGEYFRSRRPGRRAHRHLGPASRTGRGAGG